MSATSEALASLTKPPSKPNGRPPIGKVAMTGAERQARYIAKLKNPPARSHLLMQGARQAGSLRSDDFYETPRRATEALLEVEAFAGPIWEPACGLGAISAVLEERGHDVISTDLVDRGYGCGRIDFLLEPAPLAPNVITNPPFKLAAEFAQHACDLSLGKVALLCRLGWLAGSARRKMFGRTPLARVWAFSGRLPMMHRHGYAGPKTSSAVDFAWFVFERGHAGPTTIGHLP